MLLGAAMLTISGCASVPMADPAADTQAKTFVTAADKANLYIYRNENLGAAIKMPVLLNDKSIGDTAAKTYIFRQVDPGSYTITSKSESDSKLQLDVEGGKNYFIWQEVKMGTWAAGSKLQQVDETKGTAGVKESKMIK
ncbi:MAG: DUF2846 domain-containing protein [Gammaproteobacteria bacterium]|nr:DUF2846 domain-containing protein [Gammaproteobacteria bacterium]